MDLAQIVLGLTLLAVSSLTLAGPSLLESHGLVYAMTGSALAVGTGAWLVSVARDAQSE
ncbi:MULTISPECIES: hypothetical protein [Natrialbaceae]|uniref:hypothetical protein n=1 Tax=Natrialbaceae TaxID=1644061 RepID=UPI00207D3D21|nr:hypothetical protein [Natronococcus sp. CG52]